MIVFPHADESTESFLSRRGDGRSMLLINVIIDGTKTSAWENTTRNGAWRARHGKSGKGKLIDHPNVQLCADTMSLSSTDATKLAKELQGIARMLPDKPIGNIKRTEPEALDVLEAFEGGVEAIRKSLNRDLTTSLFLKRRELGKYVSLMAESGPSPYGRQLLRDFIDSQTHYADLPELGRFVGDIRGSGIPSDKGGKIRAWIKAQSGLYLPSGDCLGFVEYELKPLRVSQIASWTCQLDGNDDADPRRDSMDILLSCDGSPVHTEVKAQNDSFCSSAFVQVLYYGCALANEQQRRRLRSQFPQLNDSLAWLALIAEKRDEIAEPGFDSDRKATLCFLKHSEIKNALRPFFRGVFVVIVEPNFDGSYSVVASKTDKVSFDE